MGWLVTLCHVTVGQRQCFQTLLFHPCGHFLAEILFSKDNLSDDFPFSWLHHTFPEKGLLTR